MSLFMIPTPPWMEEAACASTDPAVFFPEDSGNPNSARRICRTCPVREQCLQFALESEAANPGTRFGVYGGLSANQRKSLTASGRHKEVAA